MTTSLSSRWPGNLDQQVRHLISRRKRVGLRQLRPTTSLTHELLCDLVAVADVILEVERHFHLTIPDEVPVHPVGDLTRYVRGHFSPVACA